MTALLAEVWSAPTGRIALPLFLCVLGAWARVEGLRWLAERRRWAPPLPAIPDRAWRTR